MSKPMIICLTPVKNEAWILDRFLRATSLWADRIIVADQNSTDGSKEIAQSFEKVVLIENKAEEYSESERQRLLIDAARRIEGPRLLVALDADEFLTPNFISSDQWKNAIIAAPKTVFRFRWANLRPNLEEYWVNENRELAYMDDGSPHEGTIIHSTRIPRPNDALIIHIDEVEVIHYQYVVWNRMQSKHRWYQCWERVNRPDRSPTEVFRQYHHMFSVSKKDLKPIPSWWLQDYLAYGVDLVKEKVEAAYWWDKKVLDMMETFGPKFFVRQAIWDADWQLLARYYGLSKPERFHDQRAWIDKLIHFSLRATQPFVQNRVVRMWDKVLQTFFKY